MGIDLQLSGHTHAGQTFPFGLVARRVFKGLHRGLHRFGDFTIYISPGAGTWGPPMRVGQCPEITVIRLLPYGRRARIR
jgi:predicted MPP superfamily phosphohydrolase